MADRWEDWFEPGETLIWEGSPAPGFRHVLRNLFFTAFGIPFFGAGLFVSGMGLGYLLGFAEDWNVWHVALGIVLAAFGVPFIAVGAGMVFGPWLDEYLKPSRVRYALTDRNGYVASRLWKRGLEVLPLRAGTRVEYEEHTDGTGSVYFYFEDYRDSDGDRRSEKKGFEKLAEGHEVYQRIRGLLSDRDRGSS